MFSSTFVSEKVKQEISMEILKSVSEKEFPLSFLPKLLKLVDVVSEDAYKNALSSEQKVRHDEKKSEIKNEQKKSCSVCMDELYLDDNKNMTTPCSHTFHTECLHDWCERNPSCPLCREDLSDMFHEELLEDDDMDQKSSLESLRSDVIQYLEHQRIQHAQSTVDDDDARFFCLCGRSVRKVSVHQHFRTTVHREWLNDLSVDELKEIM